jgi:hypothetical protein
MSYNEVLYEYIELYKHQPPRQAELVVPQWALDRLNELPEEQRKSIWASRSDCSATRSADAHQDHHGKYHHADEAGTRQAVRLLRARVPVGGRCTGMDRLHS